MIQRQSTNVLGKSPVAESSTSQQRRDSQPESKRIKHLTLEEQSRMLREQVVRDITGTGGFNLKVFKGGKDEVTLKSQNVKSSTPQAPRMEVKMKEP